MSPPHRLLLALLTTTLLAAPALAAQNQGSQNATSPTLQITAQTGRQTDKGGAPAAADLGNTARALPVGAPVSGTPGGTPENDTAALLQALRRGLTRTVRGTVRVTVAFPPRTSSAADPVRTAAQLPALPFAPALLRRNFTVVSAGTETLAGRLATRYELTPHNPQAARWTLWIDARWGLPLGYRSTLSGGTLAREAIFLEADRAVRRESAQTAQAASPALRTALLGALPGLLLPAGFGPVAVQARGGGAGVVLSDGLNVLALVLSDRPVQAAPGVASRPLQGGAVWLVGTLPQTALDRTLAGLTRLDLNRARTLPGTFLAPAPSDE